jgi:hypothetical protein
MPRASALAMDVKREKRKEKKEKRKKKNTGKVFGK